MLKLVGWIVLGLLALPVLGWVGALALPGPFLFGHLVDGAPGSWQAPGVGGLIGGLVGGVAGLLAGLAGLLVGLAVLLLVLPAVLGALGLAAFVVFAVVARLVLLFAAPVLLPLLLVVGIVCLLARARRSAWPPAPRP